MGCRKLVACQALGLSLRTIERWEKYPHVPDSRQGPKNGSPNKLDEEERKKVLEVINMKEYGSLSPWNQQFIGFLEKDRCFAIVGMLDKECHTESLLAAKPHVPTKFGAGILRF
jgi:hypothetical protein